MGQENLISGGVELPDGLSKAYIGNFTGSAQTIFTVPSDETWRLYTLEISTTSTEQLYVDFGDSRVWRYNVESYKPHTILLGNVRFILDADEVIQITGTPIEWSFSASILYSIE